LPIGWRRSIFLGDFSNLGGAPVAGDSYWSSRRRCAAVTHLQIPQPIGTNAIYFLNIKSVKNGKNLETTPNHFSGLDLHVISIGI